jgi:hypothetical protein
MITIEVSPGELIDKWSILSIKRDKMAGTCKWDNIAIEMDILAPNVKPILKNRMVYQLYKSLLEVNLELWDIEDDLRRMEKREQFDEVFIARAREVYITNDERAQLKAEINEILGSKIREEKSYEEY